MLKYSLSKLIMEFVGTMLFTMFFYSHNSAVILLGLWILNIFFWKISGSHFNPAVTFAFMFRRDDKRMSWKLALAYMMAQTLGAYIGALILDFYTFELPPLDFKDSFIMRSVTQELSVSFVYVFFFMTSTDEKLLFSNEKAINCFILASAYVGARCMFAGNTDAAVTDSGATLVYGAVANPAVALGIQFATLINEGFSAWKAIYIYPLMPFAGSFLAAFFYELVYKKTQAFLANANDDDSASDEGKTHD